MMKFFFFLLWCRWFSGHVCGSLEGLYDAWNQGDQDFHRATSGTLGFRVSLGSRNVMDQIERGGCPSQHPLLISHQLLTLSFVEI